MDVISVSKQRFTTKKYDTRRKIDPETVTKIETLLQMAPSSLNTQPWHYIIAGTEQGRDLIAQATDDKYAMNAQKIRQASHVVVFCVRDDMDEAHLKAVLEQQGKDGRFATPEVREAAERGLAFFTHLNRPRMQEWLTRQVYLSLGYTMLGVAALGIDSTSIEGIDVDRLDELLHLREKGLHSLVVLSLGYHADDDFNAQLPKSRLPTEYIITHL